MKIKMQVFRRFIPVMVGLFVLPLLAQIARANVVDFSCGSTLTCNGTVTDMFSGGALVSATDLGGITVSNGVGHGPVDDQGLSFTFKFDTTIAVPPNPFNILLTEQSNGGLGDGSFLVGTILSTAGSSQSGGIDNLVFTVLWTSMSGDFSTFLGNPGGIGPSNTSVDTIDLTLTGATPAFSVDVAIGPTPEPGSLLLLGSGLLGVGGFLRRRIFGA